MTDSHTDQQHRSQDMIKESLSSLVDGEASDMEVRRLLKACDENPELRKSWNRYQIVSQVIQDSRALEVENIDISTDISMKVKSLIADEPTIEIKQQSDKADKQAVIRDLWPNVGRFAIAASVAAVVVLGATYNPSPSQPVDAIATSGSPLPSSAQPLSEQIVHQGLANKSIVQTASHSPTTGDSGIRVNNQPITINSGTLKAGDQDILRLEQQLNRLMLEHVENTSQNNYQGILPYVRIPGGEE